MLKIANHIFGEVLRTNHISIGIYANRDHVVNIVRPEDLQEHVDYNKSMRAGRALIIDGECFHKGYLDEDEISIWKQIISTMKIDSRVPSSTYR